MAHGKGLRDIHQEVKSTLREKERFGQSKYEAKQNGTAKDGIYSYQTAKIYNRECQKFAEYVRAHSPDGRYTRLQDAFKYAKDYIAEHNADLSKSAYTVKLERSALAKLYGVDAKEIGEVRDRSRSDITRSRNRTIISEKTGKEIKNPHTRAGNFSEKNHPNEVAFARGTGMRRSEMESVRGNQLYERADGSVMTDMDLAPLALGALTKGVTVEDIRGNCPQSMIMLAIFGDTASVEAAIEEIRRREKEGREEW